LTIIFCNIFIDVILFGLGLYPDFVKFVLVVKVLGQVNWAGGLRALVKDSLHLDIGDVIFDDDVCGAIIGLHLQEYALGAGDE
jgi:hypothetical protein